MTDKLQPFYNYSRTLAGAFDPERLQPEDIFPASTPEQAAKELSDYMIDWTGDLSWRDPTRIAAVGTLIADARHTYFHGRYEGEPAVLAGLEPGPWGHFAGYRDWLWRVAEPGTRDRPFDDLREVHDPELPIDWASSDYSAYRRDDDGFDAEWPVIRTELFSKPLVSDGAAGQQQNRRSRGVGKEPHKPRRKKDQRVQPKYGTLTHSLGDFRPRRVGTVPFNSVWLLANEFWKRHVGKPLRVNFSLVHDDSIGRLGHRHTVTGRLMGPDATWCVTYDESALNSAAHFWAALCGKLDLLLDLDAVEPDRELWGQILTHTGVESIEITELSKDQLIGLERQRLLLIAERTERAARGANKTPK